MLKNRISLAAKLVLTVLAVVLLVGAASCGKKPIQHGVVDQELTVDEIEFKGKITFSENNASGTDADSLAPRAIIREFEKQFPNVKVVYEESGVGTFAARISSGDIGDVFWGDASNMHDYYKSNALMPLDYYIKPMGINLGDIYSGAIDVGKINGNLYMAPRNIGEHILIYNKDMLSAAGIDYDNTEAMTWDEFKTACRKMTVYGEDGSATQVGASLKVWWHPIWQVFFRGYGGKWIDTKEHKITITGSAEVMQGINELFDAITEGWLYPEDIASQISGEVGKKYKSIGNTYTQACFKNFGDLSWTVSYGNAYDTAKVDWDFCPFPALPTHTVSTGATGYLVYNRTSNPNAAAAFALFFLTEAGQRAYHSQSGGNVPLLKSLAHDDFWHEQGTNWTDKNYEAFVSYPDCTLPASVITQAPKEVADLFSTTAMQSLFVKILSGSIDIQTAFNNLQTQANEKWLTIAEN